MAQSGHNEIIVGTGYRLRLEWSLMSQSIPNNTSSIDVTLRWISIGGGWNVIANALLPGAVMAGGETSTFNQNANLSNGQNRVIWSGVRTINHNTNGTGSFSMYAWWDFNGTLGGTSVSRMTIPVITFNLPTIARASSINANPSFTVLTNNLSVGITRQASSFSHDARLSIQNAAGTWVNIGGWRHFTGTSLTITPTASELTSIFTILNGTNTRNSRIELRTRNGSANNAALLGDVVIRQGTITAPAATTANSNPSFTLLSHHTINLTSSHSGLTNIVTLQIQNANETWRTIRETTTSTSCVAHTFTTAENIQIATALGGRASAASRVTIQTRHGSVNVRNATTRNGTITAISSTTVSIANTTIEPTTTTLALPFTLTRANTLLRHDVVLRSGTTTIQSFNNHNTSSITLSAVSVNDIRNRISSGTMLNNLNLQVTTRFEGIIIRSATISPSFTVTLNQATPTLQGTPTFLDVDSTTPTITTNNQWMVQNNSQVRVNIPVNYATAMHGSSIVRYEVTFGTYSRIVDFRTSAISVDFGRVNISGPTNLSVRAIDLRNNHTSWSTTVQVVAHRLPTITASALRNDGFSELTTLRLSGAFTSVIIETTQRNSVATSNGVQYRQRVSGTNSWSGWVNWTSSTSNFQVTTTAITLNLNNRNAFDIEFRITDRFGSTSEIITVPVGQPTLFMDPIRNAVSVNGLPTGNNRMDVHGRLNANEIFDNGTRVSVTGHTHNASAINTGTLGIDRIPNLPAERINSGSMSADRIGSGTLSNARIPLGLRANSTIAGQFTINQSATGQGNGLRIHGTAGNVDGSDGRTEFRVSGASLLLQTAGKHFTVRVGETVSATAARFTISNTTTLLGGDFTVSADRIASGGMSAERVISGTMSGARISEGTMNANRIGSGTMDGARIASSTLNPNRLSTRGSYTRGSGDTGWIERLLANHIDISATNLNGATSYTNTSGTSTSTNTAPVQMGFSTQGRENNSQLRIWLFRPGTGAVRYSWITWSGVAVI